MATNMDRPLSTPSMGLFPPPEVAEVEIEIVPDTDLSVSQEGALVDVATGEITPLALALMEEAQAAALPHDANLAEVMDQDDLLRISSELLDDFDNDINSRKDWEETFANGLKLLGLKFEERNEPWEGACGVFHPLLTEAVVRFQSESIMETFPAQGPVRTKILGKDTREKRDAAQRVQDDMNYQLTEVMVEYRGEHEKMLWNLPITGSAFKKVYFDPSKDRQVSLFVPAEDMVLPYGTTDITSCERMTHRMRRTRNDLLKMMDSGFYAHVDLGDPAKDLDEIQKKKDEETGFSNTTDERYTVLEMLVEIDLPGFEHTDENGDPTGIGLPYVITILKDNGKVLSVRRNWMEGDPTYQARQHFVHYQYIPGFGAYGFGLIHLVGGAADGATSILRQLVDAGTLSNLPGGFKTKGMRVKGEDTPIGPGEFRDVDVASGTLKENIVPLPYKEPSQALLVLLDKIVDEARRFAATADLKVSDMSAQAPVGTTLAVLERQLKIMSAVQARMHFSLKQELKLIAGIIRDNLGTNPLYDYDAEGEDGPRAKASDYSQVEIIPVSDPNAATMSQRIVQYQAAIQLASTAPNIYDMQYLHRQMLEVLGVKNTDKIIPMPEDAKPLDPIAENMNVLRGKPLKAFAYQDHQAHLMAHTAFMQDPMVMQGIGQNPQAQQMMAGLLAHMAEHTAFAYRLAVEQQLGVPLPPLDEEDNVPISPQDEKSLAPLVAQAAQQVALKNQQMMAQQQAQQAAQDPTLMLEAKDLQIKEMEVQRKEIDSQRDNAVALERLAIERQRLALEERKNEMKLMSENVNKDLDRRMKMADSKAKNWQAKYSTDTKTAMDIAKASSKATEKPTTNKKGNDK